MESDSTGSGRTDIPGSPADITTADPVDLDLREILDAIDVSIVVLDRNFTVASFNRPAAEALNLAISDIGRSPRDLAGLADLRNLERWCAHVVSTETTSRHDFRNKDQAFVLRIAPYSSGDHVISGTVLTFTNVTAFRASIDQAIYEREYTKAILNTVIDPLVVLDAKLQVQTANRAFYSLFGLSRDETQGISIRKFGNHEWETSEAWKSIEATLAEHTQFQATEIDREFPAIGR